MIVARFKDFIIVSRIINTDIFMANITYLYDIDKNKKAPA